MAVAAFLMFWGLGSVRGPIWDEAYYLPSTARYHAGRAQFASHPPLGLMLIAAGDTLHGGNAGIDQRPIAVVKTISAEAMPSGYDYFGPRLAPAAFAVAGAGLFFLLMLELAGSVGAALVLSALYLGDTVLLAQSRAAHLDPFQLAFVLAALLAAARAIRLRRPGWIIGFAVCLACASLVRANAVMLAPIGLFVAATAQGWRQAAAWVGAGLLAGLATIALVLVADDATSPLLPDTSGAAGRHDIAFLAPRLVAQGGLSLHPADVVEFGLDAARYMDADHRAMTRHDANSSHPWQWLLTRGAITYLWSADNNSITAIMAIPNPAVWLLSLCGVLGTLIRARRGLGLIEAALLFGWLSEMALLLWLDGQRVLYLYSYLVPVMLGQALLARLWRECRVPEGVVIAACLAVAGGFALLAPLALHHTVSQSYRNALAPLWRD